MEESSFHFVTQKLRKAVPLTVVLITFFWASSSTPILRAQTMESTNYMIEYSTTSSGGTSEQTSASYRMFESIGEFGTGVFESANYRTEAGIGGGERANTPDKPTLSNPDQYYNKLNFIIDNGSNPSDVRFAIAITGDNWVTTEYVQSDNFVRDVLGAEDWQTYTNWGGAVGENVYGLLEETTYKIKVKACTYDSGTSIFGNCTEYSPESDGVATSDIFISYSLNGVGSSQVVEGQTTDVATTSNNVDFGEFTYDDRQIASQYISVATNAVYGYTLFVYQDGNLTGGTEDIDQFPDGDISTCKNSSPCAWASPSMTNDEKTHGHLGYHTSDESLGTGTPNRFSADDTYCAFESDPREVGYSASSVTGGEDTYIVYSLEVSKMQSSGIYTSKLTYIVSGTF